MRMQQKKSSRQKLSERQLALAPAVPKVMGLEEQRRSGMELALRLLSYRARSTNEIRERLGRKKIAEEAVSWVIEKLEDSDYLNDREFTRMWIRDRMEVRGYGRQRIRNELLARGIQVDQINDELENTYPVSSELERAKELAVSRLSRYADLDQVVARRRLTQFLLRRGFSASTAQSLLRELMSAP